MADENPPKAMIPLRREVRTRRFEDGWLFDSPGNKFKRIVNLVIQRNRRYRILAALNGNGPELSGKWSRDLKVEEVVKLEGMDVGVFIGKASPPRLLPNVSKRRRRITDESVDSHDSGYGASEVAEVAEVAVDVASIQSHAASNLQAVDSNIIPWTGVPLNLSKTESSPSSDKSASFETESILSEDGVDSDTDESFDIWGTSNFLDTIYDELQQSAFAKHDTLIDHVLNPMIQDLIDGLMKDFWTIFNQEWAARSPNSHQRKGSSYSTASSSSGGHVSGSCTGTSANNTTKRALENDGDYSPEDNNGNRNPKRPRKTSPPDAARADTAYFSCPYRKNNPRKYTHRTRGWRSCAMSPFDTVARMKQHLFRCHRIFQCERCNELFRDEQELKKHFMAVKACELQPPVPADGITEAVDKRLRSRKKTHREQSADERWKEIYGILFPNQIVPSPYFEPPRDEVSQSPFSSELADYEAYSRHELPRVFRTALEAAVTQETQSIGDRLRSQLVSIIQESQDRVFSRYRSRLATDSSHTLGDHAESSHSPPPQLNPPSPSGDNEPSTLSQGAFEAHNPRESSTQVLENFFQRPPLQNPQPHWDVIPWQGGSEFAGQNASSDSGYMSNSSVMNTSCFLEANRTTASQSLTASSAGETLSVLAAHVNASPPQTSTTLLDGEPPSSVEFPESTADPNLFSIEEGLVLYRGEGFDWDL